MTKAENLLAQLNAHGVVIEAKGNKLRIDAPPGVITPRIRESLKESKDDLLKLIPFWPPECLEAERRFGHYHARLYPLMGRRVVTPEGRGGLWRVFANSIGVILDSGSGQVTFLDNPEQIFPGGIGSGSVKQLTERRPLFGQTKNQVKA